MTEYAIGDRVKVRMNQAERYIQPWRDRFKAGRAGTVVQLPSVNVCGYLVEFDTTRPPKYPSDWRVVIPPYDLEPVAGKPREERA